MRLIGAGFLAIVIAACGGVGYTSPKASPGSSVNASAGAWKLPVAWSDGLSAYAGFISLPGGVFSPDHRGDLSNNHVGSPPLVGTWSRTNYARFPTYDLSFDRWVPVSPQQLTADGKRYAYHEWVMPSGSQDGPARPPEQVRIHVVDVAAATDHVVYSARLLFTVGKYAPEGIYLTGQCFEGCGSVGGMWLLDPATGKLKTVLAPAKDRTDWRWFAEGVAWGTGPEGAGNVFRLDLRTGSVSPWFTPPNAVMISGLDGHGFPLVEAEDTDSGGIQLWDATSASRGVRLFPATGSATAMVNFDSSVTGACGTFVGSNAGPFELTAGGAFRQVRTTMTIPPGSELVVAGDCIAVAR